MPSQDRAESRLATYLGRQQKTGGSLTMSRGEERERGAVTLAFPRRAARTVATSYRASSRSLVDRGFETDFTGLYYLPGLHGSRSYAHQPCEKSESGVTNTYRTEGPCTGPIDMDCGEGKGAGTRQVDRCLSSSQDSPNRKWFLLSTVAAAFPRCHRRFQENMTASPVAQLKKDMPVSGSTNVVCRDSSVGRALD